MVAEIAIVLIVIISSVDARGLTVVDVKGGIGSAGRAWVSILEGRICILVSTLVNAGSPGVRLFDLSGLLVID